MHRHRTSAKPMAPAPVRAGHSGSKRARESIAAAAAAAEVPDPFALDDESDMSQDEADQTPASGAAKRAKGAAACVALPTAAVSGRVVAAAAAAAVEPSHPSAAPAPSAEGPCCPRCSSAYECEQLSGAGIGSLPRVLPCGCTLCTLCLTQILTHTDGPAGLSPLVRCPSCGSQRRIALPPWVPAASVSTPAAWAKFVPLDPKIVLAVRNSQQEQQEQVQEQEEQQQPHPQEEQQQSPPSIDLQLAQPDEEAGADADADADANPEPPQPEAVSLSFAPSTPPQTRRICCAFSSSCERTATVWCRECDSELCPRHDAAVHALALAKHKRTQLEQRVAERQARFTAALQAAGAALKQTARVSILQLRRALAEQDLKRERIRHSLGRLEAAAGRLDGMSDVQAQRYEAEVARLLQAPAASAAAVAPAAVDTAVRSDGSAVARAEPARSVSEPASPARSRSPSATSSRSARSAVSPGPGQEPESVAEDKGPAAAAEEEAADAAPTGLLHTLSEDLLAHIERFLGEDASLSGAQLLYRASRDGFEAADFWSRCTDKGPTLMLVQVHRNDFLFGAFTPVPWPCPTAHRASFAASAVNSSSSGCSASSVADPSSRTCLFSLINAHGRPVKLRLLARECTRALNVARASFGPGFGAGADVRIQCGKGAHRSRGCYADPTRASFQLDTEAEAAAGLPSVPFAYDKTLLAGDDGRGAPFCFFAAKEIECWQIRSNRQ